MSLNSFKNFNKHVKYKIQQLQLFTDYNLYIIQKCFSVHMFPNGTRIKHHYHHRQVTLFLSTLYSHIKPLKRSVMKKPRRFPFHKPIEVELIFEKTSERFKERRMCL